MIFDSIDIIKNSGHVRFYAEILVQYDDVLKEEVQLGTPKWWDDYFLEKVAMNDYDLYFVCSCTLPKGQYNRVTDYKKVWGLNHIDPGIYDNVYMSGLKKVYLGIIHAEGEAAFQSNTSSTILLVKKNTKIVCEDIFNIFQNYKYDFMTMANIEDELFNCICSVYKDSILLRYQYLNGVSLDIYGKDVDKIILDLEINRDDSVEYNPVYRKS